MKKILCYDDALYLGGHELQTFNALKFLQGKFEIFFIVNKNNANFIELLEQLNITIIKIKYASNRFQILRNYFSIKHIFYLVGLIKKYKIDIILNIQGNIEISSVMSVAAKFAGVKLVSYIPSCHYLSQVTKGRIISKLKDSINILYFKLPDSFITINEYNKKLIKKRNNKVPVFIIPNGIDFDKYTIINKNEARNKLNLPIDKNIIALVGRIQWHKGHDILIRMIEKYKIELRNYLFIMVGTGEYEVELRHLIEMNNLQNYFKLLGHQKNMDLVYNAIDGLVIPSRFEGTPMVLLEALFFLKPVIMTNLPEMDTYLSSDNLFEKEDIDEFYMKLINMKNKNENNLNKNLVIELHSIKSFQMKFYEVLENLTS